MVVETRDRLKADGWAMGCEADMNNSRGRSVSVKIRVHDDLRCAPDSRPTSFHPQLYRYHRFKSIDEAFSHRRTMDFLDTVIGHAQDRLIDWVTIHPRTRSTPSSTPIRTDALQVLVSKYSPTLPILLSGDVFDLSSLPFAPTTPAGFEPSLMDRDEDESAKRLSVNSLGLISSQKPSNTGLSGLMSARGLLANPALFAGYQSCPWHALETFMCNVARCPLPFKFVLHHVSEMCGPGMGPNKTALLPKRQRLRLMEISNMLDLVDFLDQQLEEQTGRKGGLRRDL